MIEQAVGRLLLLGPVVLVASILSLALIVLLRPSFVRYAMARPNARSSHHAPTPQGGGIGVVVATLAVAWGAIVVSPAVLQGQGGQLIALTAAALLLAVVGAIDDMHTLPAAARLVVQGLAIGAVIVVLPDEFHVLPQVPWWIERACWLIGGVWLVNLVNFMDGIDWMTVAEFVPVAGTLVVLGFVGAFDLLPTLVAAALLGGVLGFAPFNKPVARLFLGDVGSLPLGLLLGWLLLQLAGRGHLAAALILPLYYLADATITLARRIARREPVWRAHRTHFYQRATDNGLAVSQIVTRIFLANLALAALALLSVAARGVVVPLMSVVVAGIIVAWLLAGFAQRQAPQG
jgi:UDP-N-acetylmuramyl pentapeptide phosphotransferase/UDP-N-acetylglucosamine-1-phosphate transferase